MTPIDDTLLSNEQADRLRSIVQQFNDLLADANFDQQGLILQAIQSGLAHGVYLRDLDGKLQLQRLVICDYEKVIGKGFSPYFDDENPLSEFDKRRIAAREIYEEALANIERAEKDSVS